MTRKTIIIVGLFSITLLLFTYFLSRYAHNNEDRQLIIQDIKQTESVKKIMLYTVVYPAAEELKYRAPFLLTLIILSKLRIDKFRTAIFLWLVLLTVAVVSSLFFAFQSHPFPWVFFLIGMMFCSLIFVNYLENLANHSKRLMRNLWYYLRPLLMTVGVHSLGNTYVILTVKILINTGGAANAED